MNETMNSTSTAWLSVVLFIFIYGINSQPTDRENYCEVDDLKSTDTTMTCTDEENGVAKQCTVTEGNYQMLYNCTNGEFQKADTMLMTDMLMKCENSKGDTCPYTYDEMCDFYEDHWMPRTKILTESEKKAKELLENEFEELEARGRVKRGTRCPDMLCCRESNGSFLYPDMCGELKKKKWRICCMNCRMTKCVSLCTIFNCPGLAAVCPAE